MPLNAMGQNNTAEEKANEPFLRRDAYKIVHTGPVPPSSYGHQHGMIYSPFPGMLPTSACRMKHTGVSGSAAHRSPQKRIRKEVTAREKVFPPLCWRMFCQPSGNAC